MSEAACADADPDLFYPLTDGVDGVHAKQIRQAKELCAGCPIVAACLQAALETPPKHDHGIRGGLTARERQAIRRRAARQRAKAKEAAPA